VPEPPRRASALDRIGLALAAGARSALRPPLVPAPRSA